MPGSRPDCGVGLRAGRAGRAHHGGATDTPAPHAAERWLAFPGGVCQVGHPGRGGGAGLGRRVGPPRAACGSPTPRRATTTRRPTNCHKMRGRNGTWHRYYHCGNHDPIKARPAQPLATPGRRTSTPITIYGGSSRPGRGLRSLPGYRPGVPRARAAASNQDHRRQEHSDHVLLSRERSRRALGSGRVSLHSARSQHGESAVH